MPPIERLKRIARRPDCEINLAEAALIVASQAYPEIDIEHYLRRLDELADGVRGHLPASPNTADRVFTLNRILFEEEGFYGVEDDYYDPRNSFLNEVLDRRCGIPITLSIVYLEIGRRIGLPLEGVSFPGHFLVKLPVQGGDIVLDPFSGGVSLSEAELEQRREWISSEGSVPSAAPLGALLRAARNRDILARMLRNLKGIYYQTGALEKALEVSNWILAITPDEAAELRDRGLILAQLECAAAACEDFEHYLRLAPQAEDADRIRERLIDLVGSTGRLH
ncbi:MAG TPA: tetratricopeptide repeat protein [Gammaproteobacteria bacterium]|nr:tetratricopeptide repeat protein [Gammaproteobacteria bacterium]